MRHTERMSDSEERSEPPHQSWSPRRDGHLRVLLVMAAMGFGAFILGTILQAIFGWAG